MLLVKHLLLGDCHDISQHLIENKSSLKTKCRTGAKIVNTGDIVRIHNDNLWCQ